MVECWEGGDNDSAVGFNAGPNPDGNGRPCNVVRLEICLDDLDHPQDATNAQEEADTEYRGERELPFPVHLQSEEQTHRQDTHQEVRDHRHCGNEDDVRSFVIAGEFAGVFCKPVRVHLHPICVERAAANQHRDKTRDTTTGDESDDTIKQPLETGRDAVGQAAIEEQNRDLGRACGNQIEDLNAHAQLVPISLSLCTPGEAVPFAQDRACPSGHRKCADSNHSPSELLFVS